jgi:hypothetical protein
MAEEQLSEGMGAAFAMVPLEPSGPLLVALRDGHLMPRDVALLWVLVAHLDWRTGRAWVNSAELAAAMGHTRTETVVRSLARLRRAGMVAKGSDKRDPRRRFWCVCPWAVAATGGKHRRRLQWLQFSAALE